MVDPFEPIEVKIDGKWYKLLGISRHTNEPTMSYLHKNSGKVSIWNRKKVNIPIDSTVSGYPLEQAEAFRNV